MIKDALQCMLEGLATKQCALGPGAIPELQHMQCILHTIHWGADDTRNLSARGARAFDAHTKESRYFKKAALPPRLHGSMVGAGDWEAEIALRRLPCHLRSTASMAGSGEWEADLPPQIRGLKVGAGVKPGGLVEPACVAALTRRLGKIRMLVYRRCALR